MAAIWTPAAGKTADADAEAALRKASTKKNRKQKRAAAADATMAALMAAAGRRRYIAALDMSPRSPALCLIDRGSLTDIADHPALTTSIPERGVRRLVSEYARFIRYSMVGFAQTGRQMAAASANRSFVDGIPFVLGSDVADLRIHIKPAPTDFTNNAERFDDTTDFLMSALRPLPAAEVVVVVEAYAFHVTQSNSITALAELGGVIRNKLFRSGIEFYEVSPTTIKKWFTGSGAATKRDMFARFKSITAIALDVLLPGSFTVDVPCPHQDLVDAFASAHELHRRSIPATAPIPTVGKPKKRVKKS
jgi:Holliday junction resolvasome RuvABC endonuclease subunit